MARILTVTANPLLDYVTESSWVPGAIQRVQAFTPVAGGKGLNVARVLARHGHQVVATGFLGGPTGAQIHDLVVRDGVLPAFTPVAASTRVGFQVSHEGVTTAVMERGHPIDRHGMDRILAEIQRQLPDCALVIVGGAPPVGGEDLYTSICDLAAQFTIPCWVDAYGPAQMRALAGSHPPNMVKPNHQEYTADPAWRRAPELHLTDGAGAIDVRVGSETYRVLPPQVTEVNAVGSGDCYVAGLAHARLSGWPMVEQLRYAAAAGAANALRSDIACIGLEEIQALVPQVTVAPG